MLVSRFIGGLIVALAAGTSSAAPCSSVNNFNLGEHVPKPTLGIRIFEMKISADSPMRKLERVREDFAEPLQARLAKSSFFGSVSILPADSDQSPDFTIIGTFTQTTIGTNGFNLYNIMTQEVNDKPSAVTIVGGILRGNSPEPVTTFQCALECCNALAGIPFSELPRTGMKKVHRTIDAIAEYIGKVYSRTSDSKPRTNKR